MRQAKKMKRLFYENTPVIFFSAAAFLVLVIAVFTSVLITSLSSYLRDNIEERLKAAGREASHLISEDELAELVVPEDMEKPLFAEIRHRLFRFAKEADVLFVYYYRVTDDYLTQAIVDNDETEDAYNLETPPLEMEPLVEQAYLDGVTVTTDLGDYSVGYGGLLSAFSPIFGRDGTVIGIAGVDIPDARLLKTRNQSFALSVLLLVSMAFLIAAGFASFSAFRKKEAEVEAARAQAEKASLAKGNFLANMSHEMRTPMNAIIGMTSIAQSSADQSKKEYCLKKISEASTHLLGVINDILDMSKIEANKFELSLDDFDFEKVIQKVVNVISFRVEEKKQILTVCLDKNIPRFFHGDDLRLAQVIANLLSNAVKFTPESGTIKLDARLVSSAGREARSPDGVHGIFTLQISVTDSGIGISAERQGRLFSSFEQAESGTSRKFGGTGLGLAISKQIVEMMGGSIRVESEPGKGAAFIFTVQMEAMPDNQERILNQGSDTTAGLSPAAAEHSAELRARSESPLPDNFTGYRILLAEDIEINREIVITLLEPTSIMIDCAENGAEALRIFSDNPEKYDIVFMDIQMPEMDGYEAARTIRAFEKERAAEFAAQNPEQLLKPVKPVPIIAMTANVFREDIEKCLAAGMNGHVGKPLDFEEVLGILRTYLLNST
ncbi:ATP-binding protein [Leadbettera azotonutricia]|uniref:histidine kinase n=1 Tax=Leadbettera azotonutricia (strain ATCC BAA-888 / DSM 13862 / ZAS-9) TaxID=545695 RepID=F5Y9C4_LEAAZ|nr:ATP-binding protein [Leadbettera azotonutricia]AEF81472.1 sensory box histidine kinase/response regulator [Leadbettera azotonutricia ZAS-9]